MAMITQSFLKEFSDKLTEAINRSLKETKAKVLEEKKQQFDNYGSNDWDGDKFPKLKSNTIKRKKNYAYPDKPVYRTGKLKESLRESDDPNSLDVVTDVDYAGYMENFVGESHPFNALTEKEFEKAVDFFVEDLVKEIKNAFN